MIINAAYKTTLSASAHRITPAQPTFTYVYLRRKIAGAVILMFPHGKREVRA